MAWLHSWHAGLTGWRWAQLLSGVIGMTVVGLTSLRWLKRQPLRPRPRRVSALGPRALAGATLLVGALTLTTLVLRDPYHPRVVAFVAVTHGTLWTIAALAGLTLWWRMLAVVTAHGRA